MNSRLERARSFLLGRYKSTALRVLPLALLAMGSMQAISINTVTVTGPSYVTAGSGSSILAITPNTGGLVKFSGLGLPECSLIASTCILEFDFTVLNNAGPTVELDFDFNITSFAAVFWEISNGIGNGGSVQYLSGSTESGESVPDSGGVEVANGKVRFRFASAYFGEGGFSVNIPNNSIDFSPGQTTGVPEPNTMALTLAGAAALALARRRRQ